MGLKWRNSRNAIIFSKPTVNTDSQLHQEAIRASENEDSHFITKQLYLRTVQQIKTPQKG